MILAGGNNNRMRELSSKRAIAAMPMAGSYRAIDFALSNMTNSHIQKVAVLTQYNARSLNEHLSSSKWWDFGRKQGGLYIFTPTITSTNSYWYKGTADSLYQNINFLKDAHEPYVVIASGDGVYKMDYNKVLEDHIEDNKHNFTRFLVVSNPNKADMLRPLTEANKSSIVFSLPHEEGSLSHVLAILSFYKINLTKIQSLPIIGHEWEYLFYVDVMYDDLTRYRQSIDAIIPLTKDLKILGEYKDGKQTN